MSNTNRLKKFLKSSDGEFNHTLFWPTFLIATLLLIFGVFLLFSEIQYRKAITKQNTFVATNGVLTSIGVSYLNVSKSPSYTIQVKYKYEVNEKEYLGTLLRGVYWSYSSKGVYEMVLPYSSTIKLDEIDQLGLAKPEVFWSPDQTNVSVFYNPKDPEESLMALSTEKPSSAIGSWFRYPMIAGIILAGLLFLFFSLPIAKASKVKIKNGHKISEYKSYEIKKLLKLVREVLTEIERAISEQNSQSNELKELKDLLEEFREVEKQVLDNSFVLESYADSFLGRRFEEKFNDVALSARGSELQKYISELLS